jgi:hypothetical protein
VTFLSHIQNKAVAFPNCIQTTCKLKQIVKFKLVWKRQCNGYHVASTLMSRDSPLNQRG